MLLRRFYDDKLAQASYLIGCQATGDALVVDPNRDVDVYVKAASDEGLTIRYVTETHIHADFLSGSRELARRVGAELLLSGTGPDEWRYGFVDDAGVREVGDGDRFDVGKVRLEVRATAGHTPEHIAFLVTDGAATDAPLALLSGDFLFVGDVGRPDLLEKAAGESDSMEACARTLYASLEATSSLPDHLQILPGHGAGSACGKALGAVPTSTLGYERLVNWAFRARSEAAFVAEVLADQPEPPAYFATMKRLNRDGPALLGALPSPSVQAVERMSEVLEVGHPVVDLRGRDRFAAGHLPGTLSIPLNGSFPNWAGSLLPYDTPVYLVADAQDQADRAARDLALIGLDEVAGWFPAGGLEGGTSGNRGLEATPTVDWAAAERAVDQENALLLDVRRASEWNEGHAPDARHIHLGHLADHLVDLPRDRPILAYCRSGARSSIAASLLQAEGFVDVRNVEGGILDRRRRGLPIA